MLLSLNMMLTFFGTVCLIFLTGSVSSTDENLSQHSCIKPIYYRLNISQIDNIFLNVKSTVLMNVSCTLQDIRLVYGVYCTVPRISINGTTPNNYIDVTLKSEYRWRTTSSMISSTKERLESVNYRLVNRLTSENRTLPAGTYQIYANYYCTIEKFFTVFPYVHQSEKEKYLLLPRFPSKWIIPYFEIPPIKAKFIIQIYHNHRETYALSHMPGEIMFDEIKNKSYTLFSITPGMSSYLITTVVVPIETIGSSFPLLKNVTVTNRLQVENGISYARYLIRDIMLRVRSKWEKIPWSHVSYVVLPINSSHYESSITRNLVIFNEADITYYDEIDSIRRKTEVTCLVARSVIQEIFSDWLATFELSDSWFIEDFSTFYGVYIIDQIYVEPLLKSLVVQTRREILDFTEAFITYDLPVREDSSFISPSSIFIKLWRKNAFSIFYMISEYYKYVKIYHSLFEKAINLYYNTLSNDTYNTQSNFDNLWKKLVFDMPAHKKMFFIRNLTTVITSWAHIGYPVVQVNRHNNTRTLEIMIKDCFLSNIKESCLSTWWIPVTYVKISQSNVRYKLFLQPDGENIMLPIITEYDSVILIDQPGYRVNYDRESWNNIARFLKNQTSKMSNLSDVTLAQILDDAFYFLVQNTDYNENLILNNTDNLDIFFDLASSIFHVNNSYIAWYPIFTAFEYLSKIFPYPESAHIKNKILDILNKFLEDSSHTPSSENNINNQLYYEVLKWTCILDGLKCKDIVNIEFTWHLQNPAQNKFLPSWQKWIYCQNFMINNSYYASSSMWDTLLNMYKTQSKVEEMFEFLHCSRHSENILVSIYSLSTHFLPSYGLSVDLKKSDSVTFLLTIFAKHSKNLESLTSILRRIQNKNTRIESDINIVAIITCVINNIYSNEGLSMIVDQNFLQNLMDIYRTPFFLIHAIEEKVNDRRTFLVKIKNKLRHERYDALTYGYLFS